MFAVGLSGKQLSATSADPRIRITTTKASQLKENAVPPNRSKQGVFQKSAWCCQLGKNALVETAQRALHTVAGAVQIERSCCERRLLPVISYGQ